MVFRMMMNGAAKASKGTKAKVDGRAPCSSRLKLAGRWVSTWYPVEIRPATAKPMASAKNDWIDSALIQPQRLRNRYTPHPACSGQAASTGLALDVPDLGRRRHDILKKG